MNSRNCVSLSATPATIIVDKPYYDLESTITVIDLLTRQRVVDGVEIQNLAEWRRESPPRDDITGERHTAWKKSPKYTVEEIADLLCGLPILSIHANRDVGIYLCSGNGYDITTGKTLLCESLELAEKVRSPLCVIHLWDTWKPDFDVSLLKTALEEAESCYTVKASVENVPTHMKDVTPFDLVREFEWITLDTRWAAMYDELAQFESVRSQIANIHLRGELQKGRWVLNNAPFTFSEALNLFKTWKYRNVLTVEPEGGIRGCKLEDLKAAMDSVRK